MSNKKSETLLRVLDAAAVQFMSHRFEQVSVAAIAQDAHCSTATIYECYENKDNLFVCAMSRRLRQGLPALSTDTAHCGLRALIALVETRVTALCSPASRSVCQTIAGQSEIMQHTLSKVMADVRRQTVEVLTALIDESLGEGTLRPLSTEIILHNIMAITGYEATLVGLIFGIQTEVSLPVLMRSTFVPLVTDRGHQILNQYIQEFSMGGSPTAGSLARAGVFRFMSERRRNL